MEPDAYIPAEEFCQVYQVEATFVSALEEYGLVQINTIEERKLISKDQLPDLERFMHLYYELEINMPGIDAITHILNKVRMMQTEIEQLKSRLRRYE
jgi:hypothetical protein